jgi:hypothetical protein
MKQMSITISDLKQWVAAHRAKISKLPCRVDEMTPRENELFNMLAAERGFIVFLQEKLNQVG